jgi:signal transduction histidine kinase
MSDLREENLQLRQERDLLLRRLAEVQDDFARSNQEIFKVNEALMDANLRLKTLDRLKDTFLSMITHELRTPLTVISGMAETLQEGVYGPLNEEQMGRVLHITEAAARLRQLVNDLLDLSRMEAGMMQLRREPLDPRSLADAVIWQLSSVAEKAEVQLINRVSHSLPEVDGDGQRIEQILTNLISNALKFTPRQGSITITAELQADKERTDEVAFCVSDTGTGIAPEMLGQIFDKFVQAHPFRDDRTKGTGLGLAIVRHLVELHGGQVSVTSKQGEGTQFYFTLPVYQH